MLHCYLCSRLIWPWQASGRLRGICHASCLRLYLQGYRMAEKHMELIMEDREAETWEGMM